MSANRRIKRILKVALIQMCPTPFLRDDNLALALKLANDSLKKGANLIVFPELFDSGYCVALRDKDFAMDFTKPKNHATFKALSNFAKENAVHIVACGIEKSAKKLYDTAYIIAPSGKCVGKHRKIYLWGDEKSRFSKGKKYEVFSLNFGNFSAKVGLQICYEIGFGVGANILALKGAEILIYPSAFGKARAYNWDLLSRARAVENGCFVLACNHSGIEISALNSSLGASCVDFGNLGRFADSSPVSHPKFPKNSTTSTANTRICDLKNIDSALSTQEANSSIFDEKSGLCSHERGNRTDEFIDEASGKLPDLSHPTGCEALAEAKKDAEFAGDSRIISPQGKIIKKATNLNEAIIAQINLDEIFTQREAIPYLRDFSTKLTKRSFGEI